MAAKINMNVLKNKKGKTWKEGDRTDQTMVVCTSILGILTFWLLVFAIFQFFESKESSHKELRAYIVVWGPVLKSTKPISDSLQYYGSYNEGNLGNTPAFEVQADKELEIIDTNHLKDPKTFNPNSSPVFVGAHLQFPYIIQSSKYSKKDIDTVGKRIFFYGKVIYKDVFKKDQWLTFCFVCSSDDSVFHAYYKYNDASIE
jgi:hypothetical protein